MTFETQMWRALGVFRVLALGYAVLLYVRSVHTYAHPVAGAVAVAIMAGWTGATIVAYRRPAGRGWPVVALDVGLAGGLVVASRYLNDIHEIESGAFTLPSIWVSAAVLAAAIRGGRRIGILAALVVGAAGVVERHDVTTENIHNIVLLVLAGAIVGHVGRLACESEETLARALQVEAATRERERLARGIHDSVLQVLALVQRRGAEIGGEAAELGRLAGEQELALRTLVTTGHDQDTTAATETGGIGTSRDLRTLLRGLGSARVTVSVPGTPVVLPATTAGEVAAAVAAALDNVDKHAGPDAHAWILVEDEPAGVLVSVRDDGPGIAPGRLAAADAEGRLGVTQSIRGRLRDLGGEATITGEPGQGTEIELRIPRRAVITP